MDSPNIERREIDRVLRLKRKQRESKACYPCRQRKVKCDGAHPCRTCVRRDHPQICAYNVEETRKKAHSNGNITDTAARDTDINYVRDNPRSHVQSRSDAMPSSPDSPRSSAQNQDYVFSGDNSLVSILRQQDPDGDMAREATSVLGLHNTYLSYPFIESKTPHDRWVAILDSLPHRDEVLKYVPLPVYCFTAQCLLEDSFISTAYAHTRLTRSSSTWTSSSRTYAST